MTNKFSSKKYYIYSVKLNLLPLRNLENQKGEKKRVEQDAPYYNLWHMKEHLGRYRNDNKVINLHKKKTSKNRGLFLVLLNEVFPCFHCFRKPLLHTLIIYYIFFFLVEGDK